MSFKKNKYQVIKGAISKELADFCYQYFLNKRAVARHLFDEKYISQFTEYFGVWNDNKYLKLIHIIRYSNGNFIAKS